MSKWRPFIRFEEVFNASLLIDLCKYLHAQVIITDDIVGPLYMEKLQKHLATKGMKAHSIVIPHGEASKSRQMKQQIEDKMLEIGCGRDTIVIALGGGMISDLAGFVAATYFRGVPAIYVPTTLLAMADAAIGGKTGVNTPYGKNLIGSFTQPVAIFMDTQVLMTLKQKDYNYAFSEIIKHALVSEAAYFDFISNNIKALKHRDQDILTDVIKRSCDIKSKVVARDQKENGLRAILNFGHTVAHALEVNTDYKMSHGQAVGIGIIIESYLSMQLGLLSEDSFYRIKRLLGEFEIGLDFKKSFSAQALKDAFFMDKKSRRGVPYFVLLEKIGKVACIEGAYATTVEDAILEKSIDYLFEHNDINP